MFKKFALKLVAVIAVTFASAIFFGCGQSQEEIVCEIAMDFTKNVFAGNADAVKPYSTAAAAEAAASLKDMVSINPKNKNAVVSAVDVTVNDNNAIVKVLIERPGEDDTVMVVPLVKNGDNWLVNWTKTNGGME